MFRHHERGRFGADGSACFIGSIVAAQPTLPNHPQAGLLGLEWTIATAAPSGVKALADQANSICIERI